MKKVIIVTGASSGIGKAAYDILKENNTVYSISRRECDNENHIICDVTDKNQVENAVEKIYEKEKRIDVLINCAGMGISGAIEFTDNKDVYNQFSVNFFGLDNITREVVKIMRNQESGRIVNISSVAAVAPIPFQSYYSASKAALNSYTCALANELRPFNVSVCALELGDIKTGFTDARKKEIKGDDVYKGRITKAVESMEHDERCGIDPKIIGKYIGKIVSKKHVKPLYVVCFKYKMLALLIKLLPMRFVNYILYKMY